MLYEAGIPNLVCGYTLGSQSVAYCFWATVTLTLSYVPSLGKIMCRAYIVYCFKEGIPNLECGYMLGCQSVPCCFGVNLTLTSGTSPILFEEKSQI